jgi:peptidoglycan hydrolase-like protein with peptidoglycan-binding domain
MAATKTVTRPKRNETDEPEPTKPEVLEVVAEPASAPVKVKASKVNIEFRRRLAQGDHGAVVSEVQRLLTEKKLWNGPTDGRYGSMLARAVRQFQSVSGLKVHGEVDLITWKELVK